ncbi:hypothetical protein HID58_040893 [Brassica napus]|uniref:(rape) hypothetical protein n=1 Tax=Brassica napus TaxID=3708 RepID=A0A816RC31_BRANA|nr:hypothetical protein HID58_040893 [Brassica napus]CAF2069278.1 unnamed protein product [Brassica napus]
MLVSRLISEFDIARGVRERVKHTVNNLFSSASSLITLINSESSGFIISFRWGACGIVVGEWNKEEDGAWNFHPDPTDFGFEAMIRDNETFESLMSIVRMRYVVGERTPIVLSYQFSSWTGNEQSRCINTHRQIT